MQQLLIDFYFRYWKGWGWFGHYPDWAAAVVDCEGYDTTEIFEKVKIATCKVKLGQTKCETNKELMKWVENISTTAGIIRILDFGGALGSIYFQHREILNKFPHLIWCVVEQKDFVEIGQAEFEDNVLKFEYTIEDALKKYQPNAVLLSSVLMYIEKPYNILEEIFESKIPHIMIDRTPFISAPEDRLTVQIAIPSVYKASYPCWIFSEQKFLNFTNRYAHHIKEFPAFDKSNILNCNYKGMIFEVKIEN